MDDDIIQSTLYLPDDRHSFNKFEIGEATWDELSEAGKILFNYLNETLDVNKDVFYSLGLFKVREMSNEDIARIYKIISCSIFNISLHTAQFISEEFEVTTK